jgi:hypothetical protein
MWTPPLPHAQIFSSPRPHKAFRHNSNIFIMLILRYGSTFPWLELAPIACSYHFFDTPHCTFHIPPEEVHAFATRSFPGMWHLAVGTIRAPECDAETYVHNRFAYTNVLVYHMASDTKRCDRMGWFARSLRVLSWMRHKGVQEDILASLEAILWEHLDADIAEFLRCAGHRMWLQYSIALAEVCYAPDYEWKTGAKKGYTTMQWVARKHGLIDAPQVACAEECPDVSS